MGQRIRGQDEGGTVQEGPAQKGRAQYDIWRRLPEKEPGCEVLLCAGYTPGAPFMYSHPPTPCRPHALAAPPSLRKESPGTGGAVTGGFGAPSSTTSPGISEGGQAYETSGVPVGGSCEDEECRPGLL